MHETRNGWVAVTNEVSLTPQDQVWRAARVRVPVLRGWELGYLCTDHRIRQIGATISDFRYEPDPASATGTLFYTLTMLLSDDSGNLDYASAVVDVFGMNARGECPHPILASAEAALLSQ
jgi:hypothetical protein